MRGGAQYRLSYIYIYIYPSGVLYYGSIPSDVLLIMLHSCPHVYLGSMSFISRLTRGQRWILTTPEHRKHDLFARVGHSNFRRNSASAGARRKIMRGAVVWRKRRATAGAG